MDRARRAYRLKLDAETAGPTDRNGMPLRAEQKQAKHMAREAREGRTSTGFDWLRALETYGHRCALCGTDDEALTVDHIIPIARGGGNWQWNIRPLCSPCNGEKGDRLDLEYARGRKI